MRQPLAFWPSSPEAGLMRGRGRVGKVSTGHAGAEIAGADLRAVVRFDETSAAVQSAGGGSSLAPMTAELLRNGGSDGLAAQDRSGL
jgi:hypothetical protein